MAVNVLASFGVVPTVDLHAVRAGIGGCGRIMVDSGAFSAYTLGKTITVDGYAAHLDRWRGAWDHAVTLDVIGNPTGTAANTRRLHERGYPVLPVFTLGGRLAEFDAMVADARYVCVGGLVGLPGRTIRDRVGMLQRRAAAAGGGIHALGVGSVEHLLVARPYSGDSAAASLSYRFGRLTLFDGRRFVSVLIRDRAGIQASRDLLSAYGIDVAALLRARRMPIGAERRRLTASLFLAYACADEMLRRRPVSAPVPPRHRGTMPDGPVVYVALGSGNDASSAADLGRWCHGTDAPRAWRRWGRGHTCHPATAADTVAAETGETA